MFCVLSTRVAACVSRCDPAVNVSRHSRLTPPPSTRQGLWTRTHAGCAFHASCPWQNELEKRSDKKTGTDVSQDFSPRRVRGNPPAVVRETRKTDLRPPRLHAGAFRRNATVMLEHSARCYRVIRAWSARDTVDPPRVRRGIRTNIKGMSRTLRHDASTYGKPVAPSESLYLHRTGLTNIILFVLI